MQNKWEWILLRDTRIDSVLQHVPACEVLLSQHRINSFSSCHAQSCSQVVPTSSQRPYLPAALLATQPSSPPWETLDLLPQVRIRLRIPVGRLEWIQTTQRAKTRNTAPPRGERKKISVLIWGILSSVNVLVLVMLWIIVMITDSGVFF